MGIYSIYIVNRAGSLIYHYDHVANASSTELVKSYSRHPIDLVFKESERLVVQYGDKETIGLSVVGVNDEAVQGKTLHSGQRILDFLAEPSNFPIRLRFAKPRLTSNERIMLGSMFHSLYAIAAKLSPVEKSSGIEVLEAENFKLHCFQTLTGLKFMLLTDPRQTSSETLLRKFYEIYSDYALKNPFYSLDMPIRCELFDEHLKKAVEQTERVSAYATTQTIT
ncbi:trafficking protein particle complex subunit 4-like isoform X2 [Oscarella lobularis]|uniref:trafficking protein particle complex subunit 4-like isoform X2 n=1 Tax=Oscarella lobularis TaxID=121494 RepID=UPI0033132E4E